MIVFPNCKINLGLRILRKRTDGYHDLETVFYPLPFFDILEIVRNKTSEDLSFTSSGLRIDSHQVNNLCVKAYQLLKKDFDLPSLNMHLYKAIPSGAGLGGGSADAAFALRAINEMAALNISTTQLLHYALQLGSDCPFFIINQPCFASGRGELLENVNISLVPCTIVIVNPGIHISTALAFSSITPASPARSVKDITQQPISTWKDELINDFEKPVFEKYPEIAAIKSQLYSAGALYASLSGSGSTVFGIFNKGAAINLSFPETYFIKQVSA